MFEQLSFLDMFRDRSKETSIISRFIQDGEVNIGHNDWTKLRFDYSEEEIIDAFCAEILSGNVLLPLRKITYEEMLQSFQDLINYKCNDYHHGPIFTRYEYSYPLLDKYILETNVGNVASDYFHQQNRYKTGSINSPSPVRTWENEKFLRGALKALFSLKQEQINTSVLRTCLHLRKYVASQFKPAVAKSIYEKFNSEYVLDFSSGWGDRLCGFYATDKTKHYIGIDPNTDLIAGYAGQTKAYSSVVSGKSTTIICSPAEDVRLEKESVDTIFTSPPYFNIERYSNDDTQSYKRYKGFGRWLYCFLFRALDYSCDALQKNGHLIINISDVYSGHKVNNICDPMNAHLASIGMSYVGCVGMAMAKRPNSKASGHDGQIFTEPLWIWRKQ